MGACSSSPAPVKKKEHIPAGYEFGRDATINKADYILTGLSGTTVVKKPGSIAGQQFVIDECTDCDIFLLDHISTITIDRSRNCRIFVGPTSESLFIRDCQRCSFIAATRQFRTRDCNKCVLLLYSATQPVIESSHGLRIGCFQYGYFNLQQQFDAAQLSPWDNHWSHIHDFTPGGGGGNWETLPVDVTVADVLSALPEEAANEVGFAVDAQRPVVPLTQGAARRAQNAEQAFVCLLPEAAGRAAEVVQTMRRVAGSDPVSLIQTKELPLDAGMASVLFEGDKALIKAASKGRTLGFEWCGTGAVAAARAMVMTLQLAPPQVYVAQDSSAAGTHIRSFFDNWREEV